MKMFDMDSPLMTGLNKFADLIWLNILTIVCCIPIITAGASLTAMHYMCLKIARDEECYITKGFFKSFKMNFKQATIIWILELLVALFLFGDLWIIYRSGIEFHILFHIAVILVAVLVLLISAFVFPVLAKFDNTIFKTIKNSLVISMAQLPKSIVYIVLTVLVFVITIYLPQVLPMFFFFGLSYPAFLFAKMYSKFFEKLENQILEANGGNGEDAADEDEHIFSDEVEI